MRTLISFLAVAGILTFFAPVSGRAQRLSDDDAKAIAEKYPNVQKTPSGLMYLVTAQGDGGSPSLGSRVTVKYEGRFLDGMKFDGSEDHGGSFTFTVGIGKVIKGWDEAILTMKKGEKRTLIIPYWLGYGDKLRPPIPPRSTLIYDVELLSF